MAIEGNHTGDDLVDQIDAAHSKLGSLTLDETSAYYNDESLELALTDPDSYFTSGPPPFDMQFLAVAQAPIKNFASGFGGLTAAQLIAPEFIPWTAAVTSAIVNNDEISVTAYGENEDLGWWSLDSNGNANAHLSYSSSRIVTQNNELFNESLAATLDWSRTSGAGSVNQADVSYTRSPLDGGPAQRVTLRTSGGSTAVEIQKYVEGPGAWSITVNGNFLTERS